MAYKTVDDVTGGAGFTIGHNQQIGIWFFGKIAHFFGNPEQDAENMKLPGWLNIFNNNVTSVAIIMTVFVGAFMAPLGISWQYTLVCLYYFNGYQFLNEHGYPADWCAYDVR